MPLINKTAFARMVKKTPRQIRKLASEKRIKENGDGMIDTDDPLTVKYINKVSQDKEEKHKKEKSDITDKIINFASLEDQKLQADIQLKQEQALAVKTKRAQMLGLLIPRSMVDYKLSKLSEAISANLLTIPRRGTARSLAIIQAELEKQNIPFDVRQLKVHLELVWKELVSEALEKAKDLDND